MKIESRKWVAVWYRCPKCGAESGNTMLTPRQWKRMQQDLWDCHNYKHERCQVEVVKRRWYTTFCIENGISGNTIAGTLAKIGPFTVCQIVHPNSQVFRRWVRQRKAERAKEHQAYLDQWRKIEEDARAKREREPAATTQTNDDFDPFFV